MYSRLSQFLSQHKKGIQPHPAAPAQLKDAAVLALLFREEGVDHLVFTKRSQEVLHHKGQICFPGGACDETDADHWATALRESQEEIGLNPALVTPIGMLGQIITPSGYRVTPFVGSINSKQIWQPSPHEIEEVFSAPVDHFLDPENFQLVKKEFQNIEYEDPLFRFQSYEIWGATGRILVELMEAWKATLLRY